MLTSLYKHGCGCDFTSMDCVFLCVCVCVFSGVVGHGVYHRASRFIGVCFFLGGGGDALLVVNLLVVVGEGK